VTYKNYYYKEREGEEHVPTNKAIVASLFERKRKEVAELRRLVVKTRNSV